jgi:transposase
MLDTTTGEVVEVTLKHEGDNVREFYSSLPRPVRVGIEATGSLQWFLNLMEELGIGCQVGHPAQIRAATPRKQKNDRRDAELILKMLVEGRFPPHTAYRRSEVQAMYERFASFEVPRKYRRTRSSVRDISRY